MATYLDPPDYAASAVRMAEDDLCAPPVCPRCHGAGEEHYLACPPDPQTRVDYPCTRCGGSGLDDLAVAIWAEHQADVELVERRERSW